MVSDGNDRKVGADVEKSKKQGHIVGIIQEIHTRIQGHN